MGQSFLRRLRRDQRGASALEFAILAPVLIGCWFGLVEVGEAISAGRKAAHAASSLADLVSQKNAIKNADMNDCFEAANELMNPFSASPLKLKVTSVTRDDKGKNIVDWSDAVGMGADTQGAVITDIPSGLLVAQGDSVVVAKSEYTLSPTSQKVITDLLTYKDAAYAKPRAGHVGRDRTT